MKHFRLNNLEIDMLNGNKLRKNQRTVPGGMDFALYDEF